MGGICSTDSSVVAPPPQKQAFQNTSAVTELTSKNDNQKEPEPGFI